jgi:glutathione S-transferase
MALTLYHCEKGSNSSQKVLLCLAYKGLKFKSNDVDLTKSEHREAPYLAVNPSAMVPTLIHDGHTIKETSLINEYLERVFREPRLTPDDPLAMYNMQYLCKLQEYLNEQCIRYFSYLFTGKSKNNAPDFINQHPQIDRRRFLRRVSSELSSNDIVEMETYVKNTLASLDQILQHQQWLCGAHYSLADIAWTVTMHRLYETRRSDLIKDNNFVALDRWHQQVRALDNFKVMPAINDLDANAAR